MSSFLKFVIFICLIILLPIILNISDNVIKIFKLLRCKNCVSDKILEFSNREFRDFILEFLEKGYKYEINFENDDVYLNDGNIKRFLYYDNKNCEKFTIYDARNIVGVCESKGERNIFIFTTKILGNDVVDYFNNIKNNYDIKYIHGDDLKLNYEEFICKFYST